MTEFDLKINSIFHVLEQVSIYEKKKTLPDNVTQFQRYKGCNERTFLQRHFLFLFVIYNSVKDS